MSVPGYDEPPPAYDETSGQIEPAPNNLDPSAPPSYEDVPNNEGMGTENIPISNPPQQISQSPPRTIYIVKMPNEATPIITVISPDLIPQYQNEHIVYPKGNKTSQIQVIQPKVVLSNKINNNTNTLTQQVKVAKKQRAALFTEITTKKPLYSNPDTNLKANVWKPAPVSVISSWESSKTMVAHAENSNSFQLCGSSDVINFDKRIPSEIPNKYNLMYGRMNLLIILFLWIVFIMIQIERDRTTAIIEYCYTEYSELLRDTYSWSCAATNIGYIACNQDPVCLVIADVWDDPNCSAEWEDCQCCADTGLVGGIQAIYIAFYVFLGVNTFRLLIFTFALGMASIGKAKTGLYLTDPDTNKVILQQYMNYLCDHPASYFIGIFYSDAGKAMTEGIIYNVAFPSTKFLYLNIVLLYIPFFTLIGIITAAQINLQLETTNVEVVNIETLAPTNIYGYAAPTPYPTYPTYAPTPMPTYPTPPTTPMPTYYWETTTTTAAPVSYELKADLLIICIIALFFLCIGFVMHIYRWRKKNMMERMNLKLKAESEGKQIIVGNESSQEDSIPICGFKKLYHDKRMPSDTPHKFNVMFRWINLFIFVYLWILFVIGLVEYGWWMGDIGACIAFIVFLCLSSMRLMVITVISGIRHVDNEYNYILNDETGKVKLRYFMDYLCDHPTGIMVGFLYPDVERALKEGLMYNITFPEAPFLFANILIFYLPIMIISSVQAGDLNVEKDLTLLYSIAAVVCGVGIVSNGYRFKMKNDVETANRISAFNLFDFKVTNSLYFFRLQCCMST